MDNSIRILKKSYRNVFFVHDRNYWSSCPFEYSKEKDLVLSYDFSVIHSVKSSGGEAQYIDHLVCSEIMESYNYKTYHYFAEWHLNSAKQDIFSYRGIDTGSAYRIEIWNDVTYYVRIFVNLNELFKNISYETIYAGINDPVLNSIFIFLNLSTINWTKQENALSTTYYFPVSKWMEESLHPTSIKRKFKVSAIRALTKVIDVIEIFRSSGEKTRYIHVEQYHPTAAIISELKKAPDIRMTRSDFSSFTDMFSGLCLPLFGVSGDYKHDIQANMLLDRFEKEKIATLFVDAVNIGDEINKLIIKKISPLIAKNLKIVDLIISYFASRKLRLMIAFASIGVINRLIINYCKSNNVPVYMIINGLLANSFLDEAKVGTWTNSYGESVKANYFKGMKNIVCLGDPRMDYYATHLRTRTLDIAKPVIGIGASGFTNVDLNCYLAIEFEFLFDVLTACRAVMKTGKHMDIILKIRSNGYIQQYTNFIAEYFPDIPVKIFDKIAMKEILEKVDFLISIYSQTLFEASCIGIPALYYKNDTQIFHPPFDGQSELATAYTQEDLITKIEAFYNHDAIYSAFIDKVNMEKYIGPLDGQNLKRNIDFIYSLLDPPSEVNS